MWSMRLRTLKQRNVMTDKIAISDYEKILVQLEKASESLINAIVIFQRHWGGGSL